MTPQVWLASAGLCALAVVAAPRQQEGQSKGRMQGAVAIDLGDWPEVSRKAGEAMIQAYGPPHEATPTLLIRHDNGPWAHTIVSKEPVQHDFPMPHEDVLEQSVHYRVPPDRFDELANYDGSVMCERTKGVMSARCDKEAAHLLAPNLAHDIVQGDKDV